MLNIPQPIQTVVSYLKALRVTPVLVGGVVRDHIMVQLGYIEQIESYDWDIELFIPENFEVELLEALLASLGKLRIDNVGGRFPVWNLSIDDLDIDFSLPREETKIGETRKDFEVSIIKGTFSTELFKKAANRRDFTIGAMGYNLITGDLLDPFNGAAHIKNKILVAVNSITFKEDALRVLRGIRFSAKYDMIIDPDTYSLMHDLIPVMAIHTTKERISGELLKMLDTKYTQRGVRYLRFLDLGHFLPLSNYGAHCFWWVAHQLSEFNDMMLISKIALFSLHYEEDAFFNLLQIGSTPERIARFMRKKLLTIYKNEHEYLGNCREFLLELHDLGKKTNYTVDALLSLYRDVTRAIVRPDKAADLFWQTEFFSNMNKDGWGKPFVTGKDLIDVGYKQGPHLGEALKISRNLQIQGYTKHEILKWLTKA